MFSQPELLLEFCEFVIKPFYTGRISVAITDLTKKAVEEQKSIRESAA